MIIMDEIVLKAKNGVTFKLTPMPIPPSLRDLLAEPSGFAIFNHKTAKKMSLLYNIDIPLLQIYTEIRFLPKREYVFVTLKNNKLKFYKITKVEG